MNITELLLLVCCYICNTVLTLGSWSELYRCPHVVLAYGTYVNTDGRFCYEYFNDEKYFDEAQEHCQSGGGNLIQIRDASTQRFVMKSLRRFGWNRNGVWIGATDKDREGHWYWVTGDRLYYNNWASGQPNCKFFCMEDCAVLWLKGGGKWHDKPCHFSLYHYTFICQYNLRPKSTTTTTTTTTITTTPTTTTTTTPSTTSTTTPSTTTSITTPSTTTTTPSTTTMATTAVTTSSTTPSTTRSTTSSILTTNMMKKYIINHSITPFAITSSINSKGTKASGSSIEQRLLRTSSINYRSKTAKKSFIESTRQPYEFITGKLNSVPIHSSEQASIVSIGFNTTPSKSKVLVLLKHSTTVSHSQLVTKGSMAISNVSNIAKQHAVLPERNNSSEKNNTAHSEFLFRHRASSNFYAKIYIPVILSALVLAGIVMLSYMSFQRRMLESTIANKPFMNITPIYKSLASGISYTS